MDECKHQYYPDEEGHPYCRLCGKYAYGDYYKPIKFPTIQIDKIIAKKWADEMLEQAKWARLSGPSLIDLLNEIRKALSNEGKPKMDINDYLEIIKQNIVTSTEDINKNGLWEAYQKVAEYIKNTQQSYKNNKDLIK